MVKNYNPAVDRLALPPRIAKLPVDERGFPIPKFVSYVDGKPDFRCVDSDWLRKCIDHHFCWICGEVLGRHKVFAIGPMCAINRTSSEPPGCYACMRFSVQACPFLTQPKRIRNVHDLPENSVEPGGLMIERNPGVTLLWVTLGYKLFRSNGGVLFRIGDPLQTEWWARGRMALRDEILHSIETGIPALRKVAEQEGPEAVKQLERQLEQGLRLVPTT